MKNVIIAFIGTLIVISIAVIIKNSRETRQLTSPVSQQEIVSAPTPDKSLLTYTDESGFAFQYPQGVRVNRKDPGNSLVYSSLELTATGSADIITVRAEESSLSTIDDFFKGAKKTSIFGEIKNTKLADLNARLFEANNTRTVIALDQGVLFTISTGAKKNTVLSETYEKIIRTFSFVQPSQSIQTSQDQEDNGSDVTEEGDIVD